MNSQIIILIDWQQVDLGHTSLWLGGGAQECVVLSSLYGGQFQTSIWQWMEI